MTTQTTTPDDENASTRVRPKYIHLGIDGDGAAHCYRTTDDTVHVIRDGRRVHREVLADHTVNDWMVHAADLAGWASQQYYRTLDAQLADAIGGGD